MAYAVVVSLKQTLEPLLDPVRSRIQIPNSELKIIYDDLCYLKSFFDKLNSLEDSNSVEELDKQIKDVLERTQDLIEFHISDLVHSGSESSISRFSRELVEVKDKLGSLVEMIEDKEDYLTEEQPSPAGLGWNRKISALADVDVKSRTHFGLDKKIVGLEDEKMMLKQRLLRKSNHLAVFSIIGMGGIGKTTLAKEVYLDPLIKEHFDICLFVEIDIEYEFQELMRRLLGQLLYWENEEMSVDQLGESLFKHLYGRRYMIVLDDMWDIEAWDRLRLFFPDTNAGSAIILTTRLYNLAFSVCREENIIRKRLLTKDESWELLCKMAFSDIEQCPLKLEEMGKKIVEKLGGLPLAIVTIGKLLSVSERTAENWMAVAQNMSSPIGESTIPTFLNLSYTQLPQRLKACFLYLGLFPPNYYIPTAQLIKLWIAEGFIEPAADKSLEQKAEEYLEDLVSRSLVIVHELSSIGRIKTCTIHELLRYLCVTEAQQQKLFHVVNEGTTSSQGVTRYQRRLGIHSDVVPGVMESLSRLRSLVFICRRHQQVIQRFRWLRVFHALSIRYCKFPDEVLKLVRLRYLAITCDGELPSSISRLWNLEVLIIYRSQRIKSCVFLPLEIWKLHKLRHLQCMGFDLPDPSMGDGTDFLSLRKLLTLSGVSARSCIEGVLARMPNLIKLGIRFAPRTDHAVETFCFDAVFTHLHRLESFKCAAMNRSEAAFSPKGFPSCLRKLTLSGCEFVWGAHMPVIAHLPNLQVLKLRWRAFCGREWESYEGMFVRLKVLVLEDLDIKQLTADSSHFPCLEQLLFRRCYNLKEIPLDFGDIPTLKVIEVDDCSMSLIHSAKLIQEEQEELGNDYLQVRICSSSDERYVTTAELDSTLDTKLTPAPIPLKTISQLQEDEKSGQFWVYATISSLEKIGAWAYLACQICFTKLEPDDDDFFCHNCNTYDIGGRLRYNLTLRVTDENGAAILHLWDCEFLTLIAETAYELNKAGELEELPMEIESLIDKKALFKVLVKEGQTKNFTGAYSVTKVISGPKEMKKFYERYSQNQVQHLFQIDPDDFEVYTSYYALVLYPMPIGVHYEQPVNPLRKGRQFSSRPAREILHSIEEHDAPTRHKNRTARTMSHEEGARRRDKGKRDRPPSNSSSSSTSSGDHLIRR